MQSLQDAVDEAAERTGFSGVVRLDRAGEAELSAAYGFADRAHGVPNTVETQFATASGTKTLTALAVMSLVERGTLTLGTTARSTRLITASAVRVFVPLAVANWVSTVLGTP